MAGYADQEQKKADGDARKERTDQPVYCISIYSGAEQPRFPRSDVCSPDSPFVALGPRIGRPWRVNDGIEGVAAANPELWKARLKKVPNGCTDRVEMQAPASPCKGLTRSTL